MFFHNNLLKIFYSAMLTGIPSVTYNPINNNIFHAPVVIKPFSTYINYRLNFEQYTYIKNILDSRSNNLLPIFSNTLQDENKDYYLSVNIYNCSSPIFNTITQDEVTRCEINTYVTDSKKILELLLWIIVLIISLWIQLIFLNYQIIFLLFMINMKIIFMVLLTLLI